jgi:hypothetical protein
MHWGLLAGGKNTQGKYMEGRFIIIMIIIFL